MRRILVFIAAMFACSFISESAAAQSNIDIIRTLIGIFFTPPPPPPPPPPPAQNPEVCNCVHRPISAACYPRCVIGLNFRILKVEPREPDFKSNFSPNPNLPSIAWATIRTDDYAAPILKNNESFAAFSNNDRSKLYVLEWRINETPYKVDSKLTADYSPPFSTK